MTEHQKQTAFLQHIIHYDVSDERQILEAKIARVQRDARCVQKVASVMVLVSAVAIAVLAYGAILLENFPYNQAQFVIKVICALGLASLICLVVFVGLLTVYHKRLNQLREECRHLIKRLLESHLGAPRIARAQDSHQESDGCEAGAGAVEGNGSPDSPGSLRAPATNVEREIIRKESLSVSR